MYTLLKQTFSTILKEKRAEFNYTIEKMAEKCCISSRQYYNLEHGKYLPKVETLVNIIIVLDFSFDDYILSLIKQGYKVLDKDI